MRSLRMVEVYVFNFGRWMAPAAPIVISTIGRPSFFSMRLNHFGCHRTDLSSSDVCPWLKARSTVLPPIVWRPRHAWQRLSKRPLS
jgi:hypothetical protein